MHAGQTSPTGLSVLLFLLFCGFSPAAAQDAAEGITTPTILPAFDPRAPSCRPPQGLQRKLALAKDNEREFVQGIDHGLAMAARARGLAYEVSLANNDPQRLIEQVQQFREASIGGMVVSPVDPDSLASSLQEVIWTGAYVGTVVPPPATTILNAPQYLTGQILGEAAADYIRDELGGKARVVLLTQDTIPFLAPRFTAIRDRLNKLPGVTVVADISPVPVSKEGGLETMRTILLAHPDVDVVLGADGVVLGALVALREAGKERPDQFLGGIDGELEAVTEIRKGGSYKVSVSLNSPVFGYALGQLAADWLEGRQVPQAMDILPRALTAKNLSAYEADLSDPASVYNDPNRRDSYLKMYGNICYETRDRYLNFPWSSEQN